MRKKKKPESLKEIWAIDMEWITRKYGVHKNSVNERARKQFGKPFFQLSDYQKMELCTEYNFEHSLELPKVTMNNVSETLKKIVFWKLKSIEQQIEESVRMGLSHEIDDIISTDQLIKLLASVYGESFAKHLNEITSELPRLGDLILSNDFMMDSSKNEPATKLIGGD